MHQAHITTELDEVLYRARIHPHCRMILPSCRIQKIQVLPVQIFFIDRIGHFGADAEKGVAYLVCFFAGLQHEGKCNPAKRQASSGDAYSPHRAEPKTITKSAKTTVLAVRIFARKKVPNSYPGARSKKSTATRNATTD